MDLSTLDGIVYVHFNEFKTAEDYQTAKKYFPQTIERFKAAMGEGCLLEGEKQHRINNMNFKMISKEDLSALEDHFEILMNTLYKNNHNNEMLSNEEVSALEETFSTVMETLQKKNSNALTAVPVLPVAPILPPGCFYSTGDKLVLRIPPEADASVTDDQFLEAALDHFFKRQGITPTGLYLHHMQSGHSGKVYLSDKLRIVRECTGDMHKYCAQKCQHYENELANLETAKAD